MSAAQAQHVRYRSVVARLLAIQKLWQSVAGTFQASTNSFELQLQVLKPHQAAFIPQQAVSRALADSFEALADSFEALASSFEAQASSAEANIAKTLRMAAKWRLRWAT